MASYATADTTTCATTNINCWYLGQSQIIGQTYSTVQTTPIIYQQYTTGISGILTGTAGAGLDQYAGNFAANVQTYVYQQYGWQTQVTYQANGTYGYADVMGNVTYGHEETAEEKAEREKNEAIKAAAMARAEELLLSLLDDRQRRQYANHKHFDVSIAGKIYRLKPYDRVRLLDEKGEPKIAYCIHPDHSHGLPAADVMLAQKLLLETDEAHFLKTANAWRVDGSGLLLDPAPNHADVAVAPPYPEPEPDNLDVELAA